MTQITCLSDTHGNLPQNLKGGDLLIIAGDICGHNNALQQSFWFNNTFRKWLFRQKEKYTNIVATFGNHDLIGNERYLIHEDLPWNLLINQTRIIDGIKIFGTPYVLPFGKAPNFMLSEDRLEYLFKTVEDDTDIIISHGPPYGISDEAYRLGAEDALDYENCGSKSLLDVILRVKPKLTVFGHIHEGYSAKMASIDNKVIYLVNASHMNSSFLPRNEPINLTLDFKKDD